MINWYRALARYRWRAVPGGAQARVRVPTLVLWGKHDVALSAEMAPLSLELCDDGRLVFFEAATHWVQRDEAEADEIARRLARLAEAETGSDQLPRLLWGAAIVLLVWLAVVTLLAWWLVSLFIAGVNV